MGRALKVSPSNERDQLSPANPHLVRNMGQAMSTIWQLTRVRLYMSRLQRSLITIITNSVGREKINGEGGAVVTELCGGPL